MVVQLKSIIYKTEALWAELLC